MFLERTSAVNALRFRESFAGASLRLLSDLVEVLGGTRQAEPCSELEGKHQTMAFAARASPVLYGSMRIESRDAQIGSGAWPPTQIVLVARRPNLAVPLRALAYLLAATVGEAFGEWVGVLAFEHSVATSRAKAHLRVWRDGALRPWLGPDEQPVDFATDEQVVRTLWDRGRYLQHLFIVAPDPGTPAPDFALERFCHRVVYVTDTVPASVPGQLVAALRPELRASRPPPALEPRPLAVLLDDRTPKPQWDAEGPYFSSFVASVVRTGGSRSRALASEPVDDEMQLATRRRVASPGWRIGRDLCRIPFDLGDIARRWAQLEAAPGGPVTMADLAPAGFANAAVARRWARAVTNRQLGVAISGGGASCYRSVAAFRRLEACDVPIDVVSGVSGGALASAYYCARGLTGLARYVAIGPALRRALAVGAVLPGVFQRLVDADLDHAHVDELAVRFVPVVTALEGGAGPRAHVVRSGTVGEAVQASGSFPLGLAPTDRADGTRYTDGALSAMVPARILKDFGADYVLALNCVPGPARRNPLDQSWLGRALYDWRLADRPIDLVVAMGHLLHVASREACEDAHVYYEPPESPEALLEVFDFASAERIVEEAAASAEMAACTDEVQRLWHWVRSSRFHDWIAP